MSTESKPKALQVGRKHSILGKTFRINRIKMVSLNDITKPVNVRHTAHVGASGHNFGDLSFLEPGGRCSKTNGLECGNVDYDSPVLTKVRDLDVRSCTSDQSKSEMDHDSWVKGGNRRHGISSASDSGHGSNSDPDVSDISSENSSRDVKNDLTEDDISDLTSLDQSINKRGRRSSISDLSSSSSSGDEKGGKPGDYFEFSVDMGPSLLDDVMGTIEKLDIKRCKKSQKATIKVITSVFIRHFHMFSKGFKFFRAF